MKRGPDPLRDGRRRPLKVAQRSAAARGAQAAACRRASWSGRSRMKAADLRELSERARRARRASCATSSSTRASSARPSSSRTRRSCGELRRDVARVRDGADARSAEARQVSERGACDERWSALVVSDKMDKTVVVRWSASSRTRGTRSTCARYSLHGARRDERAARSATGPHHRAPPALASRKRWRSQETHQLAAHGSSGR